jgi:acyl transferase domain-containing protein
MHWVLRSTAGLVPILSTCKDAMPKHSRLFCSLTYLSGCVKSNIGHLEGGAGIAGLIKAILVLESGVIPPNANFIGCGPKIDPVKLKIKVGPSIHF